MQRYAAQRHVTLRRPMTRHRTQVYTKSDSEPKWNIIDWWSLGMVIAVIAVLVILR
jgi:hypothetical protein